MQLSKDSLPKLFANADDVVAEVVNAWIDGLNKLQFPFGAAMLFRARKNNYMQYRGKYVNIFVQDFFFT